MIQKNQLRQEMGVACVLIGHEMAVVDNLTDRVAAAGSSPCRFPIPR